MASATFERIPPPPRPALRSRRALAVGALVVGLHQGRVVFDAPAARVSAADIGALY